MYNSYIAILSNNGITKYHSKTGSVGSQHNSNQSYSWRQQNLFSKGKNNIKVKKNTNNTNSTNTNNTNNTNTTNNK